MTKILALKGLSAEYPENTIAAFYGAAMQDYDIIELDPAVTADGVFVVLQDETLNRTARKKDGTLLEAPLRINKLTYAEVCNYDYGVWFSQKFRGEQLPLLTQVLDWAAHRNILIKISSTYEAFPPDIQLSFFTLLRNSGSKLALTCSTAASAEFIHRELPTAQIHYSGPVDPTVLNKLSPYRDKLTVWLPYAEASDELCALIRQYAALGMGVFNRYEDYAQGGIRFQPDIISTTGAVKPVKNIGIVVDMHTHSNHSHDSRCTISEMQQKQWAAGSRSFAVTDHCDTFACERIDLFTPLREAFEEVNQLNEAAVSPQFPILSGVEIGEGTWYPDVAARIIRQCDYDVVIGSVHVQKFKGDDTPTAQIDFTSWSDEDLYDFLDAYYEEMYQTLLQIPCDIAAHLTYPLRYINGKCKRNINYQRSEAKIRQILAYIIAHGIALEINTSEIHKSLDDFMPDRRILILYKEMGGYLITLGSDAHASENASNGFKEALLLLQELGFKDIFYYRKRYSIQCTIKPD